MTDKIKRSSQLRRFYTIAGTLVIAMFLSITFAGYTKAQNDGNSSTTNREIAVADSKITEEGQIVDYMPIALKLEAELREVYRIYEGGDAKEAKKRITKLYFNIFEGMGFEKALNEQIGEKHSFKVETMFGGIRKEISKGIDPVEVNLSINELIIQLKEDAKKLKGGTSGSTPFSLFINALLIIVREGFEAILVISALVTYLVKSGNGDKKKYIYNGTIVAIVASIITAIIIQNFIKISGAQQEALEGFVMLFATVVLFYVSYWLISKSEIGRWQHYIKSKIDSSITKGSMFTLGMAAFLAVYREGAETILFYQALVATSVGGVSPIVMGFLVGLLVLVVIFYAIKYTAVVVPIGPFFAVTSTLLYYLAFVFAGKGLREIQEGGYVSETVVAGIPAIPFIGFYPTVETMLIQLVLVFALIIALLYNFLYKPYQEQKAAMGNLNHIVGHIREIHDIIEDVGNHTAKCRTVMVSQEVNDETKEICKHLTELDDLIHEVDDHLSDLEKNMEDTFTELEKDIRNKK